MSCSSKSYESHQISPDQAFLNFFQAKAVGIALFLEKCIFALIQYTANRANLFFAHAQWKQLFFTHARLEMLTNILSISFAAAIIYYVSRMRSRWCCVHPAAQFCIYYYFLTIFRACAVGGAAAWWLGEEEHPAAERDHGAASQAAGHEVRRSDRRCATTASISG